MNKINRRIFLQSWLGIGATIMSSSPFVKEAFASDIANNNLKVGILMDTKKCINCKQCVKGCNDQNRLRPEEAYLHVEKISYEGVDYNKRVSCMHCQDAACVMACPTKTLYKGTNGLTYVDKSKCIGCGYCSQVCPYEIIKIKNGKISKCVGCQTAIEQGDIPRCVRACPVNALSFGQWNHLSGVGDKTVKQLQEQHPQAQLYGKEQLKGLGLKYVLLNTPERYGYPQSPQINVLLSGWKKVLHNGGLGVTTVVAGVSMIAFGMAKKNYQKEEQKKEDEANG